MNVYFLGGASSIGASCVAIACDDRWILVDAGIRMDPNADRLPDMSLLQGKPIAAIFITHAHADHIGALPLVHQAFPLTPIYASRATMLLMDVMLNDALQVMSKRASTEFEVPLYDESQVRSTLHALRPLPTSGTTTVTELPDVVIHTSRAGHVAGACMIGFETPCGSILVSGDVSVTPQHTVPGAQLSSLRYPDLFVLESTYGARLHPNRQTEEERLAQAVLEGIERGAHVLIPAFALGRAQEVIRILHMAQQRGTIPEFPIWVDGLVRRVCATYTAIPDALTIPLQRQIQKGYPVFFSGSVRQVTDVRHRERILQGVPSCIIASSGMLTGGPSAYYAAQLAGNSNASILITGYQDDEAPGRKLLALADQGGGMLEIGEQSVTVRCHFDRYHLSAHADGNELTAMVGAIKPKQVALVHGDTESRVALGQRMERLADILLPADGQQIEIQRKRQAKHASQLFPNRQDTHVAISHPEVQDLKVTTPPLNSQNLELLWRAVSDGSVTQVINVRELALTWYGMSAGEAEDDHVQQVLDEVCQNTEPHMLFFVPLPDLPGCYRVRVPESVSSSEAQGRIIQPGMLMLVQAYGEKLLPAVCFDTRPDAILAYLPANEGNRTRYPRTAVLEVVAKWKPYPITDILATRQAIADMVRAVQRWQRQHPPNTIVEVMQEGQLYDFDEISTNLMIASDDIVALLAVALMLNEHSRLFVRQRDVLASLRKARYGLNKEYQTALAEGVGNMRPDQMWILSVLERHLGTPPDLYRKSINPDSGEVTLAFSFPAIAREQYREQLAAAAEETGITITISPQPHQGALTDAARSLLPQEVLINKISLHHERETMRLRCTGTFSAEERLAIIKQFREHTGWNLELEMNGQAIQPNKPQTQAATSSGKSLDMNSAIAVARTVLKSDTNFYKVSADQAQGTLTIRFLYPDVGAQRCAAKLDDIRTRTGWHVAVYPEPHQGAIEGLARKVLPKELDVVGVPSLYRIKRQVTVKVRGDINQEAVDVAKATFLAETGWVLEVVAS